MRLRRRPQLLLAAAALVLSACSGADEGPSALVATDTAATDPAPTRDESSPTAPRDGDRGGRVIAIPDDFPLTAGWPRRTGEPGHAGLEGGAGPPGTIERHVRRSAIEAEQVIAAMCVFTSAGC